MVKRRLKVRRPDEAVAERDYGEARYLQGKADGYAEAERQYTALLDISESKANAIVGINKDLSRRLDLLATLRHTEDHPILPVYKKSEWAMGELLYIHYSKPVVSELGIRPTHKVVIMDVRDLTAFSIKLSVNTEDGSTREFTYFRKHKFTDKTFAPAERIMETVEFLARCKRYMEAKGCMIHYVSMIGDLSLKVLFDYVTAGWKSTRMTNEEDEHKFEVIRQEMEYTKNEQEWFEQAVLRPWEVVEEASSKLKELDIQGIYNILDTMPAIE